MERVGEAFLCSHTTEKIARGRASHPSNCHHHLLIEVGMKTSESATMAFSFHNEKLASQWSNIRWNT